jgi:malate dehydrogenase (oxaloacetate-decarboxylating)
MNASKKQLAKITNLKHEVGTLEDVLQDADVFIGVSAGGALKGEWIKKMKKPIIFAMANPVPEIFPDEAKKNGAFIYGSGRSDFENQINNSLVFPGIFRGIKEHNIKEITMDIKIRVAQAISKCLSEPLSVSNILPSSLDRSIGEVISKEMNESLGKL